MSNTKKLVTLSFLIALTIILARFLAIHTPLVRASFEFVPIFIASTIFGPIAGGIVGAIADIIGATLFGSGNFFPGFTISAFITGLIYGLFFYKKETTWQRTLLAVFLKATIVDLIMVSTWLLIIFKMPFESLIIPRLIKFGIILIVEFTVIYFGLKPIKKIFIKK